MDERRSPLISFLTTVDFDDIDDFDDEPGFGASGGIRANDLPPTTAQTKTEGDAPQRVGDGKWACNHRCKDKTASVLIAEPSSIG